MRKGFLTTFFLIALALAWGAVLLPAVVRARRNSPYGAAQRFKRRMALISPPPARSGGRWVIVPGSSARVAGRDASRRAQARRRRILKLLVGVVGLTFAAGLLFEGSWWEVHVAADFALSFFVAYLLESKRRASERATKISPLVHRTRAEHRERESARAFGGR